MSREKPVAIVDSSVVEIIRAIGRENCRRTLEGQRERVDYFVRGMIERGVADRFVVVVLNVDDECGGVIARALMPGQDAYWDELRAQGAVPYARGLAVREGIQEALDMLDAHAAAELRRAVGPTAVVIDDGAIAVFAVGS